MDAFLALSAAAPSAPPLSDAAPSDTVISADARVAELEAEVEMLR